MGAGVDYHLLAGIAAVAETAGRLDPNVVALDKMGSIAPGLSGACALTMPL